MSTGRVERFTKRLTPPSVRSPQRRHALSSSDLKWNITMKTFFALTLVVASLVATPASADRPFGTSSHGPSKTFIGK